MYGQLTGIKNIPTDYPTIAAAVNALNTSGVGAGGVTFNVMPGYTETIDSVISLRATGTASNSIVFKKDPAVAGANPLITAYANGTGTPATLSQDGIWRLLGSDYVTIDGIDVTDNPANSSNPSTMEYGYALYKASTSNGCQHVTIKNCVITLNNINNAAGTLPMSDGSTAIVMMNATASAAITALTPVTGGTNSNNAFYSNTVQNCNTGIALMGSIAVAPYTLADTNNVAGGNISSAGNTIINYGGAAAASNAAAAIRTLYQYSLNVSYNIINNNNGSGTNHPNVLRGIYVGTAIGSNTTVTYNTITLNGGGTTHAVTGIENTAGSTPAGNTVSINNNIITNSSYATATTGAFYGINNSGAPAVLTLNVNQISNNSTAATSGIFYGISNSGTAASASVNNNILSGNNITVSTGLFCGINNSGAVTNLLINSNTITGSSTSSLTGPYYAILNSGTVTTSITIDSNNIGNVTTGALTLNAANSGGHIFINNTNGTGSALSISNNNFHGIRYAVAGTGNMVYISNSAATRTQAINANKFNNLNINTTGNVTFISNSVIMPANGIQNVNSNSIVGSFTKAAGGVVTLFTSALTSVAGSFVYNKDNNFSYINLSGATIMAGWVNTDAGAANKTIQNNIFSYWTGGTGYVNVMNINITSLNNATTGNIINNISGLAAVTGIVTAAGNDNIYLNTISALSTTGASPVTGIQATSGTSKNIYRNKIYDLQASNTATGSTVNGILISGSSIVKANVYNNLIGDLRTPLSSATDPIRGISVISSAANSTINVYYNTVYLNASSTGANFGTTGMYHLASATATTATLNLRNNIVNNISTFNGTGLTVAFRRSSALLGNYASTSNNNLFYAGPAGANRLLFYDITNADHRLATYKARVTPREAQSVTEDLATSKFLSVIGTSPLFLHLDPTKPTQAESGAIDISTVVNDWDAEPREGNTGYTGTGTAPDMGADEFEGTPLPVLSGSYNVGSGQTYTSLTNAGGLFAAINSLGLSGNVIINITSDLTEDGSNSLNLWAESGSGNYTLAIQPDGSTLRTISGNPAGGLIRFNGANRVTINGSNGTTGNYLTFRNTNAAGAIGTAFTFINGSSNNTISYCNIEASTNAASGVILFSTSTVTGGNSNNVISKCNISATVNNITGYVCIYSSGTATAGFANSTNTVSNNNIFNYRDKGIDITGTGSTLWVISGNSFYNGDVSGSITYGAGTILYALRILGGAGYSITNNYIGGNASMASGTPAVYASTAGLLTYEGILLTTTSATPVSNIKSNTIGRISVSAVPTVTGTTGTNVFLGIETNGSGINIGGSLSGEGNVIGSNTINGSILITTTTTVANKSIVRGINCASTGGLIIGNQVGGFDFKNIGSVPGPSAFVAIYVNVASAPSQVNNNIVGSAGTGAVSNSIRVLSNSTSTTTALTGILISSNVTSTLLIDRNVIQNVSHQSPTNGGNITGISNNAGSTAVITITNNIITYNSFSGTGGTLYGIYNSTAPASITINSDTISNNATAGTSTTFYGIVNTGATPVLTITNNTFTGNTTTTTAGIFSAIYNSGAVTTTININNNNIGTSTLSAITYNAANTATQSFINNTGGTINAKLSISNNNFQGIVYAAAGSAANSYIINSAPTSTQAINSNTFINLNLNTSGAVTFISDNVVVSATGVQNVNNNSIVGSFRKIAGGSITLFYSILASAAGGIINNISNNFSGITVTGATTVAGWVNTDAGGGLKIIQSNTFANWLCGTNAVTIMSVNVAGANNATTGNIINNISSSGTITGISTGAGNDNIFGNTISAISSAGISAIVTGIAVTAGTAKYIYQNKIYDLSASLFSSFVNGILVSGGTTVNVVNNLIGDLRTPASSLAVDALRGISITSTVVSSNINVYYNTVYLNASSTGSAFGSSGIYHLASTVTTTAVLNLRNNSITNTSTPKGTGLTVAYRRAGSSLNNYATSSNNNLFYAGTPSATRVIFYDTTTSDPTLAAYKTRVSARDAQSVTENLTTKFLSTAGSSGLFLHMDNAQATLVESGAVNIAGFTVDFDGQIRAGNPGYTGSSSSPDIGADEVFGVEVVPPAITYTPLTNTLSTTNRSVTGITITDASGINNNAGTSPRIYYKRFSDANVWLDNTSSTNGWKYTEATNAVSPYAFTINYSQLYGGSAVTAGVIQYFIVAQDLATVANLAINSGTFNSAPASVALTAPAFPIAGIINTYNIPFAGAYNVGASEVFTSLTKADGLFASLNIVGLMGAASFSITSDLSEDGANALNQLTESGVGNYNIVIQPDGATLRNISGNVLAGLIRLNNTDRLTIDGSNGGSGIYLSFKNTNAAGTTGTAFTFINGATNNTIRYCDAQASANATNGVVLFSTSSVAGGNSNNSINNCSLNAAPAFIPGNVAVYSAGTTGMENSTNTIADNTIYNYRDRCLDITATGSTGWTINGNSFYNGDVSGAINYAASTALHGIRVLGGSGYAILNNYIGGNASEASGANAVYSSSTGSVSFQGIVLSTASASPVSSVRGNTISTITVSSKPGVANSIIFTGIATTGSGINIGGSTPADGNIIGSGTVNGSIAITTATASTTYTTGITGIDCGSSGGVVNNNQVGGFDISNVGAAPAPSIFQGIYINQASAPAQVDNNLIGSITASNSIRILAASTSATTAVTGIGIGNAVNSAIEIKYNRIGGVSNLSSTSSGSFTGINNMATLASANINISNDTIQYVSTAVNSGTGSTIYSGIVSGSAATISNNLISDLVLSSSGINAQVVGMNISGAYASTISGNIISNLSTASNKVTVNVETSTPAGSAIIGILNSTTAGIQIISNNRLSGFTATSTAAINIMITGVGITAAGSGNICNNRFGTFTNVATGSGPAICHIMAAGGSFNVYNNALRISNLTNKNAIKLYGIIHASATSWNYFHNTIRVSGSSNGTALRSAAFVISINSSPVLKNNILFNIRTGTGAHYAVSNLQSPPANWPASASDYNDFYSINPNTVVEWGSGVSKTFAQWQSLTGGDAHSINNSISFILSTYDLEPDSITNCNFNNAGILISAPVAVNTDINNNPRNSINPDLGAYEFNYTGFSIIAGSNSPVCAGDSLDLTVNPGNALIPSYSWRNPSNAVISTKQNPTVALVAGQYKVTVSDSTGCYVTDSTVVLINQRPTALISSAASVCDSGLVNLVLSVTGSGTITGTLSNGDLFSGTAPTITIPLNILTTTSYSVINLSDGNCAANAFDIPDTITVSVTHKGNWLGITSNWNDPVNWCAGIVPTSATDVVIPAGNFIMPVITDSANCKNLFINTGDTLSITATGTLNIAGLLTNNGTYTDNGTTAFSGISGQQTFSGVTAFNNLVVRNNAGLLLPAAIMVKNNLTLSAGITNAGNFNITLAGNWINNAAVTAFAAGTSTVTFNGISAQSIGGAFATTFNNLTVLNLLSTVTLFVNTGINGNLSVSGGILDIASFTANRNSAGGTLTVANNATLKIGGTNTFPLNYSSNILVVASTVEYSGANQTISNKTYGNLTLSSSGGAAVKTFPATALTIVGNLASKTGAGISVTFTAASNITVGGNVSIGASTTFNGGSYSHDIGGNWVNSGTFNGNTGTVTFKGPGSLISGTGAQNFNNLTVAASLVRFSNSTVTLTGNLATIVSGSFGQASGGTLVMTGAGTTISGSGISLDNLTISNTVSTAVSLALTGNLSVSGSFTATAGIITMSGSAKSISGAGASTFNILSVSGSVTSGSNFYISSGLIVYGSLVTSAGTATFTGTSSLSGTANLYNVNINGTSLQLSAGAVLGVSNTLTLTSGILDVTTSGPNTVNFNGSVAQQINAITYSSLVVSNGNIKTAAGTIITTYDLTIGAGTTFNPTSYTISIYGNWINNGTFTAGASTVQFLGPATAYITGTTTFNILTSNTSSSTTVLILHNSISAAIVNMIKGIIQTRTDTITITNTRTGNGYIEGNIRRIHTFITGVSYAFEGPDNTVTFSAVSAVSTITVSVIKGSIGDFPFGASISRMYSIAVPAGAYTATLRLHYEDDELNGNDESTMALWRYNGSAWGGAGKSANSTTSNYIELSGLTNITNRWTASASSNLVQWNGSVSSDWNTAANWTVLQGAGSKPPAASDIVDLGSATFANQPSISNSVTVKQIMFGSAKAVTLTLGSGGSLTTLGDISGNWTTNATHTINVNNQSLTVNGTLELSDDTSGHAIALNIGSGTVTTLGSLKQAGNAGITFSGAGSLNIYQNYSYSSGIFSAGTGTVLYNGTQNQHVANVTYNNLTINKTSGIATIDSTVNITGSLLISSGELDNSSTTTIAGDVTLNAGSILINSLVLRVKGNWNNNGSYISTGASIYFEGSGLQNISASTFNNLIINKPSGKAVLTGNVIITGNLLINSGTFDIQTFDCNRNVPGGLTTNAAGATFMIGGNNPPKYFVSYLIDPASTTIFYGNNDQYIDLDGITVGNLILRDAGIKHLVANITVNGNMTIENACNVIAGSNTITLNGSWYNSGVFTPSASAILCNGASKVISGNTTFNRLTVYGSYTILNDVTFNGLLNITQAGSLSGGATINTTLNSDLINSGVLYTLGTTIFSGNVLQTLSLINAVNTVALTVNFNGSVSPVLNSTSVPQFGYLNINNTGGVSPSVGWMIQYALNIGAGASFNGGNSIHNIFGSLTNNGTITSTGTLNFIPSSAASLNLGSNFSSTGSVLFGGAGAITMTGSPASLHDVTIANTNSAGITPSSNWIVTNNFTVNSNALFNAGSYSYTVGSNLRNNGTLNRGTSSFILNGLARQDVFSGTPLHNLTINKASASVSLSSTIAIYGALNFVKGNVQTGPNKLSISSTGSITGAGQATGWINGNLQKNVAIGSSIVRLFEVGDSINYTPVSVLMANVTASGDLTNKSIPFDHPQLSTSEMDSSKTVNRYYNISNDGTAFTTASITFNWVAADVDAGSNTTAFRVKNYNGARWTLLNSTTPLPTSISATGVLAFGDFAIGQLTLALWTGALGNDWFTSGNWNSGVPLAVTNAVIPGSLVNYPVMTTGTGSVQNITIESGAALTVNGAVLQITGTINNSGSLTTTNGTIEMKGGSLQTIPVHAFTGNTIKNLTVNNSYGVSLEDTLLVTGILKLSNGNFATGGHLTLISSAAQTALIDGSGTGEVLGNVTIQRYLAPAFGYKYFSAPFQSATVNEFSDDLNLAASFPAFYRYDENQAASGWVRYTDTSAILHPGEGYAANMGASLSPKIVSIKGIVNNNAVSSPVLYNHNMPFTKGFNLVGNPYPSPIDWDAPGWSRNNIDNAVYYFNTSTTDQFTGTYSTYINGVSSDGTAVNVIGTMQGFFVHVSGGSYPVSATLTLGNSVRVNNLTPSFHRRTSSNLPLLRLSAGFNETGAVADPLVIYFEDAATTAFDKDKDALKLFNTDLLVPNLYAIASDASQLSIAALPVVRDSVTTIPLGLQLKRAGTITINARDMNNVPLGAYIYLLDAATNTWQDLSLHPLYSVYLPSGDYNNRFSIVFTKVERSSVAANPETFLAYGSGGKLFVNCTLLSGDKGSLVVYNTMGQAVYRQELSGDGIHQVNTRLITGTYIVSFNTTKKIQSKKIFIE